MGNGKGRRGGDEDEREGTSHLPSLRREDRIPSSTLIGAYCVGEGEIH